jgi:hypothetical protein
MGSFTFRIRNAGTGDLTLEYGCHQSLPISLATPAGRLPIAPGSVDTCGFPCDDIYSGHLTPGGCFGCAGGGFLTIAPGESTDTPWDRRVYERHHAGPPCAPTEGMCALGIAVAPAAAQLGAVTICPDDQHPMGTCLAPIAREFTVDTTGTEATIELGGS